MAPTEEQLDAFAHWERRAWEERAAAYGRAVTALTRGAADALLDGAGVGSGTRLLDVATGPGVVSAAARRRRAHVVAVDQSRAMVHIARAAGVEAWAASAERLPFRDAGFDAVVAGFLLNHLARPGAAVAELSRVCRGRVALSVWDVPEENPVLGLFGAVAESVTVGDGVPPGPDSHTYADDARFAALLHDAGLVDVRLNRVRWSITVEPGTWFDAVAEGTPRTGALLAAATADERGRLRERYVEVALSSYAAGRGLVTLPAAAVLGSGRSVDRREAQVWPAPVPERYDAMSDEQATGTPDPTYDVMSVVYHALQGAETIQKYLDDTSTDDDLRSYFQQVQQGYRRAADQGKQLLVKRIEHEH